MELLRRRFVALWAMASAAIAASQEPVVITAGPSTFGPPLPVAPESLKNGQCPNCGQQREDNITSIPPNSIGRSPGLNAPMEVLVGCARCHAAFWQRMKGQ